MAVRIVPCDRRYVALVSFIALLSVTSAYADCIDDAAVYHRVHPSLVRAIASVESRFNPVAHNINSNGSEDIGLMQINSAWLPTLARYGISRAALYNACTNAYVGVWILSQNMARLGLNWNAVGAYNAASPQKRLRYASLVYSALIKVSPPDAYPSRVPPAPLSQPRTRAASPFAVSTTSPVVEQRTAFFIPGGADTASVTVRGVQE